jgi:hypothetical protein
MRGSMPLQATITDRLLIDGKGVLRDFKTGKQKSKYR